MSVAILPTNRPHLAKRIRLEWDPVREQHALLAPEGVIILNQTGATILGLCDGKRTFAGIVEELQSKYDQVEEDEVQNFLSRLAAKRLLELGDE